MKTSATSCPPSCRQCGLRASGAFQAVTQAELDSIERFRSDTRRMRAGEQVIREQSKGHRLFTLYAGWAFRYKTLSDGRRQILNVLLPGDFFGLQQHFGEGTTYGVEALTDGALCVFTGNKLWGLYGAHPKLGYGVTWLAAREEQMLDENLLTTGRRSALERVAVLLIHLFKRAHHLGLVEDDGAIVFPLNQQHMADALGLSLVHTNRTLRRLHKLGLHTIADGRLFLHDPKVLTRLADYADAPLRQSPLV